MQFDLGPEPVGNWLGLEGGRLGRGPFVPWFVRRLCGRVFGAGGRGFGGRVLRAGDRGGQAKEKDGVKPGHGSDTLAGGDKMETRNDKSPGTNNGVASIERSGANGRTGCSGRPTASAPRLR